jgi:hypothetical protein
VLLAKFVVDDIWASALKAAERVEKKYGRENLGPYSKFEWGMEDWETGSTA